MEMQNMAVNKPQSDKLLLKIISSSYHMEKKNIKQVALTTYTLQKNVLAAATFEGL